MFGNDNSYQDGSTWINRISENNWETVLGEENTNSDTNNYSSNDSQYNPFKDNPFGVILENILSFPLPIVFFFAMIGIIILIKHRRKLLISELWIMNLNYIILYLQL